MSYKNRLDALKKAWETEKPSTGAQLAEGKYQFVIKRAVLEESKADWNKGHMCVVLEAQVHTGPLKGRKTFLRCDLESPSKDQRPSGISIFKGWLENLEMEMPKQLSEQAIKALLTEMVGIVFNGVCKHSQKGYANVYINDLVNATSDDDENDEDENDEDESEDDESKDTDEDEDEDDESDDDDEDEDAEEEKPKFKVKAKPAPAKPKKPAESATDSEDWEEEFEKA